MDLTPERRDELLRAAASAARRAHAPYSRFRVGAAVLADGAVHLGCNVENASSNLGLCAERVAIASAVAAGHRRLQAVAVAFPDLAPGAPPAHRSPCGACRQVMREFADDSLPVLTEGLPGWTLGELLPHGFRL